MKIKRKIIETPLTKLHKKIYHNLVRSEFHRAHGQLYFFNDIVLWNHVWAQSVEDFYDR
jgi:hypothetical protein